MGRRTNWVYPAFMYFRFLSFLFVIVIVIKLLKLKAITKEEW